MSPVGGQKGVRRGSEGGQKGVDCVGSRLLMSAQRGSVGEINSTDHAGEGSLIFGLVPAARPTPNIKSTFNS
eukprot:8196869-Pyramimonas_sp.AAC.1